MTTKRAPTGLDAKGKALWQDVAGDGTYELRPDELRVLEQACREIDLITKLEKAFADNPDYMVRGSMGQSVINPLISELRLHRATLASLLRQLAIPDTDDRAADKRDELSSRMRAVANARWRRDA